MELRLTETPTEDRENTFQESKLLFKNKAIMLSKYANVRYKK